MEHYTQDNGLREKKIFVMVKVSRSGQMELAMMVNGNIIKLTEKEPSGMCMEISTKVNGSKTKLTDTESTLMQMELSMRVIGWMIFNTAGELNSGLMAATMKEIMKLAGSMVKDYTTGLTNQSIQACGLRIKFMVVVVMNGLMEELMKVTG